MRPITTHGRLTSRAQRPKLTKRPKYSRTRSKSRHQDLESDTPIPGSPCIPSEDYNHSENHWKNWDLIPKDKPKEFPYWFEYTRDGTKPKSLHISDLLARVPPYNLHKLLQIEALVHGGDPPSPRELATIKLLTNKVNKWNRAEALLHRRRNGFYCEDQHISKKAWFSWMMTQNRDFGSAVWRWLRMRDWDTHQTAEMKGLYFEIFL
jgi:hypothetical protein